MPQPFNPQRIGVAIWLNNQHGRQVAIGAYEEAELLPGVRIELLNLEKTERASEAFHRACNRCGGVIAACWSHEMTIHLPALRVPLVLTPPIVTDRFESPIVSADPAETARLATEHFATAGAQAVGLITRGRDDPATTELGACLAAETARLKLLPTPPAPASGPRFTARRNRWLRNLPMHTGILCASDGDALELARAAESCGIAVPHHLAILGVGNDRLRCASHRPTISSIAIPAMQIGRTALRKLTHAPAEPPPTRQVYLRPTGVIERESSRMVPTEDRVVRAAADYLREHASQRITVSQVADHLHISRRTLERRFRQIIGRSIHKELQRLRLERSRHALAETDRPIHSIALESGFRDAESFANHFRRHTGHSPTDYRRTHRRPPRCSEEETK